MIMHFIFFPQLLTSPNFEYFHFSGILSVSLCRLNFANDNFRHILRGLYFVEMAKNSQHLQNTIHPKINPLKTARKIHNGILYYKHFECKGIV